MNTKVLWYSVANGNTVEFMLIEREKWIGQSGKIITGVAGNQTS